MTIRQNLQIRQGETWSFVFTHVDSAGSVVDLTGYTARMSIKADFDGGNKAYLSSGSDAEGGTIALGGASGTVTLSMTAVQSAALGGDLSNFVFVQPVKREPIGPTIYFKYDCEIISGAGVVTRILEGAVLVQREVTS